MAVNTGWSTGIFPLISSPNSGIAGHGRTMACAERRGTARFYPLTYAHALTPYSPMPARLKQTRHGSVMASASVNTGARGKAGSNDANAESPYPSTPDLTPLMSPGRLGNWGKSIRVVAAPLVYQGRSMRCRRPWRRHAQHAARSLKSLQIRMFGSGYSRL